MLALERVPKTSAYDLKLNGLDEHPDPLLGAVRRAYRYPTQILDQPFERVRRVAHSPFFAGPRDGLGSGRPAQELEPIGVRELCRNLVQIRVEPRDEVLAHREDRPTFGIAENLTDLFKELAAGIRNALVPAPACEDQVDGVLRRTGEDLFELIEHEHVVHAVSVTQKALLRGFEILDERSRRELVGIGRPVRIQPVVQGNFQTL